MAVSVVRTSVYVDSSTSTATTFFSGTPAVGNYVAVTTTEYLSTQCVCTDDATGGSNSYTTNRANNGQSNRASIARAKLDRTKANLGVTVSCGAGAFAAGAIEISGVADTDPVDLNASQTTDTTSPWTLSLSAPAQTDEILIAAFSFAASAFSTYNVTADQWSGATPTAIFINDGPSINGEYGAGAYLITTDLTARTVSFSANSDGGSASPIQVISLKGAAASGGQDMAIIQFKRGTRAQIDSAAGASQLRVAEPYLLTDEGRMALGLSVSSYADIMMLGLDQPTCWPIRIATPKIAGDINGTALSTITVTASRQYWIPLVVARMIALTGLRISVTTAASGLASVGLYSNRVVSGSDEPDQLLVSATGLDTGTTGDKTGTVSYTLQPGTLYWASVICAAAAVLRALAVGSVQPALGRTVNNTTMITYLYAAGSGSTLASPAPATFTAGTGVTPAIYLVGS